VRSLSVRTSDGQLLAADVAEPDGAALGGVAVCHPHPLYGGNRFNPVVEALFNALPRAGFTTIRFDFRAAHDGGLAERLDVVAALDELDGADRLLFIAGYSFGAVVGLATHDRRVAGIVAIAPPLSSQTPPPTVPALVLSPRHDQYCPPDTAGAIVATWPAAEFDVIESADHFLAGRAAAAAERSVTWLTERVASAT
jgi:alpha/beta superfamily hydrolase